MNSLTHTSLQLTQAKGGTGCVNFEMVSLVKKWEGV